MPTASVTLAAHRVEYGGSLLSIEMEEATKAWSRVPCEERVKTHQVRQGYPGAFLEVEIELSLKVR